MSAHHISLNLSGRQHLRLQGILYPGNGNEQVAIALCTRRAGHDRDRLLVRELHRVPPEAYGERNPTRVNWSTSFLPRLLEEAEKAHLSVVKFHSHPTGETGFSGYDDDSDKEFLPTMRNWVETPVPHGSVVMLPAGRMFGRTIDADGNVRPISCIAVAGADLRFWHDDEGGSLVPAFAASHALAFGSAATALMRKLRVGIVGCSGTGTPVIEQLVRLGVGELVLVDDDVVEERNLNRIIHAADDDARNSRPKVSVVAEAIKRVGLGTRVIPIALNLRNPDAVTAIASCDIVFGCMDSALGRLILNFAATYYTIPYFDLGVLIQTRDSGAEHLAVKEATGTVHYLQPGGSSLLNRGVINAAEASAEALRQDDPEAYEKEVKEKYIRGVNESRPAVVSLNMAIASLAVNDFLARLFPYREFENNNVSCIRLSLASLDLIHEQEGEPCPTLAQKVGLGDVVPLLGLPMLSEAARP